MTEPTTNERPALWGHPAVRELLAEVERLRAENAMLDKIAEAAIGLQKERDELRDRIAELEALISYGDCQLDAARQRIVELEARDKILTKAIEDYLNGDYENPRQHRPKNCAHGLPYWEACENCIDDHFNKALKCSAV